MPEDYSLAVVAQNWRHAKLSPGLFVQPAQRAESRFENRPRHVHLAVFAEDGFEISQPNVVQIFFRAYAHRRFKAPL